MNINNSYSTLLMRSFDHRQEVMDTTKEHFFFCLFIYRYNLSRGLYPLRSTHDALANKSPDLQSWWL